jgi:TPP-dependent indolepyruvate ferredoxin oxidoreductase alpha subunit
VPRDALGRPAPALEIERIARALGVEFVQSVGPADLDARLVEVFQQGLSHPGLGLIVVRTPCDHGA